MPLKDVVEKIKESIDIVEYISSKIPLKRVGKNYKALCPFHNEKTPSFYVSPHLKMFHCFGCGISGDIIKFVQEYEKVSFVDALKILGEYANIDIDFKDEETDKYYRVNEDVARFYHSILLNDKNALDYLKKRGMKDETIEKFLIGFAPNKDILSEKFEKIYGRDILLKLGLVGEKDRFRNRIIFPIFTISGRIAGFGGRIIGEGEPKYLNSPESPVYSKRNILYSLYHSKKSIGEKKEAVIVEGYFDYLSCFQEGIENIVATLGTALTDNQSIILSRYANKIILFFDMDEAGVMASLRNIGLFIDKDVEISIVSSKEAKDPDEIIQKYGVETLKEIIKGSKDFIDTLIEKDKERYDLKKPAHLSIVVKKFGEMLSKVQDPVKREIYIEKIARELNVKREILTPNKIENEKGTKIQKEGPNYLEKVELSMLFSILNGRYEPDQIKNIDETEFTLVQLREVLRLIKNGEKPEKDILHRLPKKFEEYVFTQFSISDESFENLYKRWRIKKIEEVMSENSRKIKELEKEGKDTGDILRLQNELLRLKYQLQKEVQ
uniref:DNA primase n=1 Tax=candidate division WOR-3 bacterium TaxID=2052148 RepID=A0A7C4UCR5_UNCW3